MGEGGWQTRKRKTVEGRLGKEGQAKQGDPPESQRSDFPTISGEGEEIKM